MVLHLGPDYGGLRSTSTIVNVEKTWAACSAEIYRLHLLLQRTQSKEVDLSEQGNNRLHHFKELLDQS